MGKDGVTRRQFLKRALQFGVAIGGGATLFSLLWMLEGGEAEDEGKSADKGGKKPLGRLRGGRYRHPAPFSKPPAPKMTIQKAKDAELSFHKAMFWERRRDGRVRCGLCPRHCILAENERGPCGARVAWGGELYTLVFGKALALNVDPIEKKPLNHFYPGSEALSLATAGCNFGCIFCQNWEISQALPEEHWREVRQKARIAAQILKNKTDLTVVTPQELVEMAKILKCRSIAFTYTEPTIFYEYMYETCRLARKAGMKTVWVTCGFIAEEPLRQLCKVLDAANVDLKGYSEDFYRRYCGAHLAPVLKTLKILKEEGVWFEITNLIIPGANDDEEMIKRMCIWIKEELGKETPVFFSRFFPHYKLKDRPATPVESLKAAERAARKVGLKHIYLGNIGEPEVTYCPKCGKALVKRSWKTVKLPNGWMVPRYVVEFNHIKDGRCAYCGRKVAGVWGD